MAALMRRRGDLERQRSNWLNHWEDLARMMLPRRGGFLGQAVDGERRTEQIFDGTAMQAARGLANALSSMLRPEGEQWLFIRAADDALNEDDEVRAWIARAEERLTGAMLNPKARFREAMGEADADLVVFGSAIVFTGRSRNLDRLTYQSVHLRDALVGRDSEGNPDTLFREQRLSVSQAVGRFGKDALSEKLRRRVENENNLDEKVVFDHIVTPRPDGDTEATLARNMPFAELWVERDTMKVVAEGGFREFPFAVPRWDTSSGEDYGRSPGMVALPDALTSQSMGETILVAGQRAADPPLFAPNDGAFDAVNTFPGGISYYDVETAVQVRGNPFFPLDTGMNLPIGRDMQNDTREQIRQAFFRNVFNLPVEGPQMTATEVLQRKEEFIREIGPVFGRLETDYIAPIVERSFNVMLRAGSFDPIPEVLQGREVRFEFESPVKKIRQEAQATSANAWAQQILGLAQAKPEALDLIDVDGLARFAAEALNLPDQVTASRDGVEALRQARAQAQQQAQQAQQVEQAAAVADQGASALSKGVPALQQLLQGAQGAQQQ